MSTHNTPFSIQKKPPELSQICSYVTSPETQERVRYSRGKPAISVSTVMVII